MLRVWTGNAPSGCAHLTLDKEALPHEYALWETAMRQAGRTAISEGTLRELPVPCKRWVEHTTTENGKRTRLLSNS